MPIAAGAALQGLLPLVEVPGELKIGIAHTPLIIAH